jgi:signal transduction histidine kinase
MVSLLEGIDGALWVGTYRGGLWRIQGNQNRHFTTKDGLSSNQIRSLYEDSDGILWIATFDGGLNAFHNGGFMHFTTKDGLLSDNVSNVLDDGESLWLSTTRGICRIPKKQLRDFVERKIRSLQPINYGVEDGLRSALCAPGYPVARGGSRTSDGRLWFITNRGLAVIDPKVPQRMESVPAVQMVDVIVDGRKVDLSRALRLDPEKAQIRIRYTTPYLRAPERVQYSHKLLGLDSDWVHTGNRREIDYNNLPRGKYQFLARAALPGGPSTETAYDFEKLPAFFETTWFRVLCVAALLASAWGAHKLRIRQLRYGFVLVLEERARLAREIHDTLTQCFIGISSQLEALAYELPENLSRAHGYLNLARKMTRHSITEARRSIGDLRDSMLEGQNLAAALHLGVHTWTATSEVLAEVNVSGETRSLPKEYEQHLLRITQEAVTNTVKHAGASKIWVWLDIEASTVCLRIVDNGRGFEDHDAFSSSVGHFGLIGMRERSERLGGEFRLTCRPYEGTQIEVNIPLK